MHASVSASSIGSRAADALPTPSGPKGSSGNSCFWVSGSPEGAAITVAPLVFSGVDDAMRTIRHVAGPWLRGSGTNP